MSLRLILTRHAKSSWSHGGLGDHERPLNQRGRNSADAIGDWLAAKGYLPEQALISSAARTQETWARIAARLPKAPAPEILDSLYLAEPEEMLAILQQAKAGVVIMIAHNPGSARLAQGLAARAPKHADFRRYPTAATTIFDFEAEDWPALDRHRGQVEDFIIPRELI